MKKLFLFGCTASVSVLIFIACAKKTTNPNTPSSTTTAGGGNSAITLTISPNGFPGGTVFSGVLLALNANGAFGSGRACFYSTPTTVTLANFLKGDVSAGSLFLNADSLNYTVPPNGSYTYPFLMSAMSSAAWTIGGSQAISAFSYTNTTSFPIYNGGTSNLPTVVNRAQNLTIPIVNASGYDQIAISINDGAGNHQISAYASSSFSSVTFLSDSLAKLSTGEGNIILDFIKYNGQNINNKNFLFGTATAFAPSSYTITLQ